jgi:hydroxymethylbilane synthase
VSTNIERKVLELFDGGCSLPLGVFCDSEADENDRLKFRVWLSFAESETAQPRQMLFETSDTDGFASEIATLTRKVRPSSVFISRNSKQGQYFQDALSRLEFKVKGLPLIEFKMIAIKKVPSTEWIFFSSKHAVRYFFKQNPEIGKVRFGCIGASTNAELRAFGHRAEFIGQSTDTRLVGKQFAERAGAGRVLFPVARGSMHTVQSQMKKKDNIVNLEVYATVKNPADVDPSFPILVFTSPSNVDAYFERNGLNSSQQVIAMGEATGKALERRGRKKYILPRGFDDLSLVREVLYASTQIQST